MASKFMIARIIMLLVGVLAFLLAWYYNQFDVVEEFLSRFVREELAGY